MKNKNWYSWESLESFDAWHVNVVKSLNLPRVGYNAATNEEQPEAQWTTSYTQVREIGSNDWRGIVESEVAEQFAEGLGELSSEPETLVI